MIFVTFCSSTASARFARAAPSGRGVSSSRTRGSGPLTAFATAALPPRPRLRANRGFINPAQKRPKVNFSKQKVKEKNREYSSARYAADKAFLAAVLAVNAYVSRKLGVVPKSHSERRLLLRRMGREDLRALYSDVVKTLYDEAFYEGVYNPEEVEYAIEKVKQLLKEVENVQNRK